MVKSYSNLRNVNNPWIPMIPNHWTVSPLKRYLISNDGGVWGNDPEGNDFTFVLRSTDQTVDGHWSIESPAQRYLTAKERQSAALKEGDLVVTKSSGSSKHIGKTTLVSTDMEKVGYCYGNFMQRLRTSAQLCSKFTWYVINSFICRQQLDVLSSTTTGLANLNGSLIGELVFPCPPEKEQQKIAQFLDYETAKIDALIDEQKRLIDLLKEKRQAVISHAVTKGLNPDAPMKDSGVAWLGEVPQHWRAVKLKHVKSTSKNSFVDGPFGSNLKSSHFIDDGYAFVIESNFATTGRLDTGSLKQISESHFKTIERSSCSEGDIIIAKIGARYGMSSVLPAISKPSVVSGNSLKLTIDQKLCSTQFANYVLIYLRERGAIEDIVNMTAQPALSLTEMNNLPFPLPPEAEQEKIVKSLSEELQRLELLANTSQNLTNLAKERRSALISAAVTGKIDVRDWQPPAGSDTVDSNVSMQRERHYG